MCEKKEVYLQGTGTLYPHYSLPPSPPPRARLVETCAYKSHGVHFVHGTVVGRLHIDSTQTEHATLVLLSERHLVGTRLTVAHGH